MKFPRVETIERYYNKNLYSMEQMKFFTDKGALTEKDFKNIVGKSYHSVFGDDEEEKEEE